MDRLQRLRQLSLQQHLIAPYGTVQGGCVPLQTLYRNHSGGVTITKREKKKLFTGPLPTQLTVPPLYAQLSVDISPRFRIFLVVDNFTSSAQIYVAQRKKKKGKEAKIVTQLNNIHSPPRSRNPDRQSICALSQAQSHFYPF